MGKTIFNAFDDIHGVKNSQLFHLVSKFDWSDKGFENWIASHFDRTFDWLVFYLEKSFWRIQKTIQNDYANAILFAVFIHGRYFGILEYRQGFFDVTVGYDDRNHDFFFSILSSNYDA